VEDREFRDDLYYRLNVIEIRLPPLRERRDDIPLLAGDFVERLSHELGKDVAEISAGALKLLMDYDWPGNVRELENAVERAIVTAKARVLTEDDFGFLSRKMESGGNGRVPVNVTLQELERQAIAAAIQRTSGNIKEAAAALGIDRSTLYEKIKRYEIPRMWRN
jgi:two-component system response regulator HydG